MSHVAVLLSTKDVLLDHLFAVIKPLVPEYAERIVGMLAECSDHHLMALLGQKTLLEETIDKAVKSLKSSNAVDSVVDDKDDQGLLGNELFQVVAEVEPALCAQITGMLLEMDASAVRGLLLDHELLHIAVDKAKHEYLVEQQQRQGPLLPGDVTERLYEEVSKIYNKNAPKITGMLAELSAEKVKVLLSSATQLKHAIELCRKALEETRQWKAE